MEKPEPFWRTAISRVEPNKILVRGYDLMDLVGKYTYADLTFLLWRGELPSAEQSRMMDALLTVCIEHSLNAPSVDATRFVASSGVPLQAAVSAGIAAIGEWHGGAIEQAAKMLQEAVSILQDQVSKGRKVIVHCLAGQGRTMTVLAGYLIAEKGMEPDEAIRLLREKRPGAVERRQEDSVREFAIRRLSGSRL
jgi:citrate synthase